MGGPTGEPSSVAGITVAHCRADCLGLVGPAGDMSSLLAEMWHTAGLTALDPLGQWQVHSQLGQAGNFKSEDKYVGSICRKEETKKIFF